MSYSHISTLREALRAAFLPKVFVCIPSTPTQPLMGDKKYTFALLANKCVALLYRNFVKDIQINC